MSVFPSHINIGSRRIGPGEPCFVIAEGGVNHFGDLEMARRLIDLAAVAKADIFKTQHYSVEKLIGLTSDEWRERLRGREMSSDSIRKMKEYCDHRGIEFLCTPHEKDAFEFLDQELEVSAFKIGSGEVGNWPFLSKIARCGKPIILSTGMYRLADIRDAIRVLEDNGCSALAILHCVSAYPTPPEIVNLSVMNQIREVFSGPVGYSDHTTGTAVPLAAVALGADIIEKHITIKRNVANAQDWKVSCGPGDFGRFVSDIREIEVAQGGFEKTITDLEKNTATWAKKSITAAQDIPIHSLISTEMIELQRPGTGMPGSEIEKVLGKMSSRFIPSGTIIGNDDLVPDNAS